jgi:predicted enzyme related to lactoylglutathione lyase
VTSRPAATHRLRDPARLRRVRDRIDREYGQPLDVEVLARGAHSRPGTSCASSGSPTASRRTPIILLATADLDGTLARLQASGADVVQGPTERPYGVRDCAFRDPAGNLIRIQEQR